MRTTFATNPAGALVDGLIFANGQSNLEWDAIWTVRTRRVPEGWSAEFAIPFRSLSFPAGQTVWGLNVARHIRRKAEEDRWAGARLETQFFHVSEAGDLMRLEGLSQGVGLDLRPFAAGQWRDSARRDTTTLTGRPGFDLTYNVTSSLKVTATVNTDFGETEVDARQINLTRFSLFFPEKRAFFLEDAGVFSFSNTGIRGSWGIPALRSEALPFFSRQIGLLNGEEVPIDVGVKVTGKIGRTDLGVLDVRTSDSVTTPARNLLVARLRRNFLQQSSIGAIVTHGDPARARDSATYGADLRLATARFLGQSRNLMLNAYGLQTVTEGRRGNNLSYGASLEYPNDVVEAEVVLREIQQDFRPALGFVSRRNVRVFRAGGRYNPRPGEFLGLQQMFHGAYFTRYTRLDIDQTESWNLHVIAPIDWHFASGDAVHSMFSPVVNYERLFAPFEISPGVVLPGGEYRFTRWRSDLATAPQRTLQTNINWQFGRYWSGTADELQVSVTYRLPPRLAITLNTNQTFADLPQGSFVARILGMQFNYSFSPFLSTSGLAQFDNLTRNLGWQSRLRWIQRPGNDVFLVFSQGWLQDALGGLRFHQQDQKLSGKLQYTVRL